MDNHANNLVKHFIQVPTKVLFDQDLSSTAKLVFGIILSFTRKRGYCFASNSAIARILNRHNNAISTSITALAKYKYIKIQNVNNNRRVFIEEEVLKSDIKLG